MANPSSTDPPGLLMTKRIGLPGFVSSKYQIFLIISCALALSTCVEIKILLACNNARSMRSFTFSVELSDSFAMDLPYNEFISVYFEIIPMLVKIATFFKRFQFLGKEEILLK